MQQAAQSKGPYGYRRTPLGPWLTGVAAAVALAWQAAAVPVRRPAEPPMGWVLVLDNCDPVYEGKPSYEDNLSCIDTAGKLRFRVSGFNTCESIGSNHMVASDPARGWVWALENVAHRVRKFDRAGKQLLALDGVRGSALAVDPRTGNLWVLLSQGTIHGDKTKVFSPKGKLLATYPVSGWDVAYDKKSRAFWIAGRDLAKVDARQGTVAFVKNITTWCASSVAVHSVTGRVWVTVRRHPQVQGSRNALLGFANDGTLKKTVALGNETPFHVSVDPKRGSVWVTLFRRSVQRYGADRKLEAAYAFDALTAEADPTRGGAWVVTSQETLLLDRKGEIRQRVRHKRRTSQAWIAVFP
jgi:hypothetical protein